MSVKKKSCIAIVTMLIVVFIQPLIAVRIVSSDAGMALCFNKKYVKGGGFR